MKYLILLLAIIVWIYFYIPWYSSWISDDFIKSYLEKEEKYKEKENKLEKIDELFNKMDDKERELFYYYQLKYVCLSQNNFKLSEVTNCMKKQGHFNLDKEKTSYSFLDKYIAHDKEIMLSLAKWDFMMTNEEKKVGFLNYSMFLNVKAYYTFHKLSWNERKKQIIPLLSDIKNSYFVLKNVELDLIWYSVFVTNLRTNLEELNYIVSKKNLSKDEKIAIYKLLKEVELKDEIFNKSLESELFKKYFDIKTFENIPETKNYYVIFGERFVNLFLFDEKESIEIWKTYYDFCINKKKDFNSLELDFPFWYRNYIWRKARLRNEYIDVYADFVSIRNKTESLKKYLTK